jgi:hypothetical protein
MLKCFTRSFMGLPLCRNVSALVTSTLRYQAEDTRNLRVLTIWLGVTIESVKTQIEECPAASDVRKRVRNPRGQALKPNGPVRIAPRKA